MSRLSHAMCEGKHLIHAMQKKEGKRETKTKNKEKVKRGGYVVWTSGVHSVAILRKVKDPGRLADPCSVMYVCLGIFNATGTAGATKTTTTT